MIEIDWILKFVIISVIVGVIILVKVDLTPGSREKDANKQ